MKHFNDLKECGVDTLYYPGLRVHASIEPTYYNLITEVAGLKERTQKSV